MKPISIVSRAALAFALVSTATAALAADPAPKDGPAGVAADSEIIVTGTRVTGMTAAESATPIKLIGTEAIEHVGQPNLNQVLTQLVPSFTASAYGGDTAELTLSARLRGLSPNHTLVLVNGKRRHGTANLNVLSGATQGGAAPDLDFIIPGAIQRIEVLEDGAAAQYGSDAIAGVINIILKDKDHGGDLSATAGQYYKSDGAQFSGTLNLGVPIGDAGFLNVTGMYRKHQHSQVGGIDRRLSTPDGALLTTLSAAQRALYANAIGYPYVNKIFGDLHSELYQGSYDAGYDLGGVKLYSFGTFGYRTADAYENYRVPDRVIASPVLGVAGTLATPGELIFAPNGFNPEEAFREMDSSITGGAKGEVGGFKWDLSATYGRDRDAIYTLNTVNASLFVDTHQSPTTIYDGTFLNKETTLNADFSKEIDVGLTGPLTIAFGAEYRKNDYSIASGDGASIYKEGGQSYPGFQPTDAGKHSRKNESLYVDVALDPTEGLKLDAAGRYEHYSDFGSEVIGKFTGRYDFTPAVAVRGTVSNGFRAPTLAEQFYSATNVSPTSATVQLPANSAAAKLLGFDNLKPEKSFNLSLGTVLRPTSRTTLTIDAYQIRIRNRIVGSGTLFGRGGATNDPAVLAAIAAHGNILDPTVGQVGAAAFTNGLNTRTRGIDVVGSYSLPANSYGKFDFTLSGSYNSNKITSVTAAARTRGLFDYTSLSLLEHSSPKLKVIYGLNWAKGRFSATVRETVFGHSFVYYNPNGGAFTNASALDTPTPGYIKNEIGITGITDLELGVKLTQGIKIAAGANNLFNKKPPTVAVVPGSGPRYTLSTAGNVYDAPMTFSPYGINGGYYYGRVEVSF